VLWGGYDTGGFYDEMFDRGPDGIAVPRAHYAELVSQIAAMDGRELRRAAELANRSFLHSGVTFTVYSDDDQGTERILPFDPIPRIVPADEWAVVEAGLRQRVRALNRFVHDVYHGQEILKDGIVPRRLVVLGNHFRREVVGIDVPDDQYVHVAGSDPIRGDDGRWLVLEDNLRTPSGVSYVLANRQIMTRSFPDWFAELGVCPVDSYAGQLLDNLVGLSPRRAVPGAASGPAVVVLTPGIYNSAYFEHAFLAQQMGVELLEGRDLFVLENRVYMRTTSGRRQVDVIYRRVDDEFLDPLAFRADSMLGVAGLLGAVRTGNVTLANAIGAGSPTTRCSIARPGDHPLLPERGADPRRCADFPAERSGAARPRAAQPRLIGRQGCERERRLRDADRAGRRRAGARGLPPADRREPAQLHRPAGDPALAPPDLRARRHRRVRHARGAPRRSAAVCAERAGRDHRAAGRADACRSRAGLPGRQLEPRRREQGHVGAPVTRTGRC
jgi:hypothetical protein